MNVLLDTHVLVWLLAGSEQLGADCRAQLGNLYDHDPQRLVVSAITFWEVAMLSEKGRLNFERPIPEWRKQVLGFGIREQPLTGDIATTAGLLKDFHGDPADRLIVSTAISAGHSLATADKRILNWPGELSSLDARK